MIDCCDRCGKTHPGCTGHRRLDGGPCQNKPIKGATVCHMHGAGAPQVARKANVRAELDAWGFTDERVDPDETVLRLLAQSSRRVALYAELLRQAYTGEPGFPEAFAGSGLEALIGHRYVSAGDGARVAVEEATRGLVKLEAEERKLCGYFAKLAHDMGIQKRMIDMAQEQGLLIAQAIEMILDRLELSPAQRALVPAAVPAAFRAIERGVG